MELNKKMIEALEAFLNREKPHMMADLEFKIQDCRASMEARPDEYIEPGTDEPSIDIRLCIDPVKGAESEFNWIFRLGLSEYDPYHSLFCSAGSIGLDSKPEDLLSELAEDVLDQAYSMAGE